MALGDLYALTLHGSFRSQACLNVFTYEQTSTGGTLAAPSAEYLARSFEAVVLPDIAAITGVGAYFDRIECYNMFDPEDISSIESLATPAGLVAGSGDSAYTAFLFQTQRRSREIRRGAKRTFGVPFDWVDGGGLIAGHETAINAAAAEMSALIDYSGVDINSPIYGPRVVKRIAYTAPSGKTAYRFPENVGEAQFYQAVYEFVRVTTQNSRKPW